MGTVAGTLRSERWLDQVVINAIEVNVDGDVATIISLPPGLGDVAIIEAAFDATSAATLASLTDAGMYALIQSAAADTVDIVGVSKLLSRGSTGVAAYFSPDPLVLWRQNERLVFVASELDTNATPTIDFTISVKAVRVRPMEIREQPSPIRLVR